MIEYDGSLFIAGSFSNSTMKESWKCPLSIIKFCESSAKSMTASTSSSSVSWTAAAGYERRRRGGADGRTIALFTWTQQVCQEDPGGGQEKNGDVDGGGREGGVMGLLKSLQCHSDQRGTLCLPSVLQLKKSSSGVGGNVCST